MRMKGKKVIFDYRDTWGMDNTLSRIITPALKKFLEVHLSDKVSGIPHEVYKELGIDSNFAEEKETDLVNKRWIEIMELMIYAFDPKSEPDINSHKYQEFGFGSLYMQDMKEYMVKKQEGLNLFAKHFTDLWN